MNRADRMLSVLRDGRWHSHDELNDAGHWYLKNNAASDLRKRGYNIEYKLRFGAPCYRLVPSLTEPGCLRPADEIATPLAGHSAAVPDGAVVESEGSTLPGSVSEQLFALPRGAYSEDAA